MKKNEKREALAEYAHEAWSRWMTHLFSRVTLNDRNQAVLSADDVRKWQRQLNTAYADLTESEKASDRREADRMIEIFNNREN